MRSGDDSPRLLCPLIQVPAFEPCARSELEPLLKWIGEDRPVSAATGFPRGTALPDGRLDLCKQALGLDGALRVLEAIDGNHQIRSLLLGTDGLGDRGAAAAAAMIRDNRAPALETLYLGCNHIAEQGVAELAEALALPHSPVQALWLKRNPVGPGGIAALGALLRTGKLRLLDLTNTMLGDEGVEVLVAALLDQHDPAAPGLERLLLGSNGVGPRGAAALARLLIRLPTLRELSLAVSRLGDEGARALAQGLAHAHGLEHLNLASCAIGPAGLEELLTALRPLPRLQQLDLGTTPSTATLGERDNDFEDLRGGAPIGSYLREEPALRRLDLRRSGLRSRGAMAVLAGLEDNHRLIDLRLGKHVARSVLRRAAALIRRNRGGLELDEAPPDHVAAILSVYRSKR